MNTLDEHAFLDWAKSKGMGLDPRWPDSAVLAYAPEPGQARYWLVPAAPDARPFFLETLLDQIGDWRSLFVWRHLGSWPLSIDQTPPSNLVELEILRGLGMPLGTADIVEFGRDEFAALVTLLFSTTVFGWSVGDDLYVVPSDGHCIVQTDHHGVIHVTARDQGQLNRIVAGMAEAGHPLPTSPPDPTFKTPEWMRGE